VKVEQGIVGAFIDEPQLDDGILVGDEFGNVKHG